MILVESIAYQGKEKLYTITFSDGQSLEVEEDTLVHFTIYKGQECHQDIREELKRYKDFVKARRVGMRFAMRRKTHKEVEQKIRDTFRDFPLQEDAIEEALRWLEVEGFLDDALYAKDFVKDKTHLKKDGPRKISAQLLQKGVARGLIEEALSSIDEEVWEEQIRELLEKKFHHLSPKDRQEYAQMARYLENKGYTSSHWRRILS